MAEEELKQRLWLVDLARPVTGHFICDAAAKDVNWASPLQVGPYILLNLPKTWEIVKSIGAPDTLITEFVARGCTDSRLPYKASQLGFLTDIQRQAFLNGQQEALAVSFSPGEHKILHDHDMVPFLDVEDGEKQRKGVFGRVTRVLEGDRELCKKQVEVDEHAEKERKILLSLPEAPHLLRLRASYSQGGTNFLILSPWVHVELGVLLRKPSKLAFWVKAVAANKAPVMVFGWMACLAAGLATLHGHRVKHIDLKPSNIGLCVDETSGDLVPFILDYGHSRVFSRESRTVEVYGSPFYSSPEKVQMKKEGRKGDVFSLGLVFMDLLGLLDDNLKHEWMKLVGKKMTTPAAMSIMSKPDWHVRVFEGTHEVIKMLRDVVLNMLQVDVGSRACSEEVYNSMVSQALTVPHCHPLLAASTSPPKTKRRESSEHEEEEEEEDVPDSSSISRLSLDQFLVDYLGRREKFI